MDCCIVAGERPEKTPEVWDEVIYNCDTFEHLHTVKNCPPYTDAFKVTIEGKEAIYYVELPKW